VFKAVAHNLPVPAPVHQGIPVDQFPPVDTELAELGARE